MSATRYFAAALGAGALLLLAGCGSTEDYENRNRPPSPINVTANVSADKVSVSPSNFGAGPIVLIVTNQSGSSQEMTLESPDEPGAEAGITQDFGPINPQDTAQLQIDLREGDYELSTESDDIAPASISVARDGTKAECERPVVQRPENVRCSAQDQLLLP